MTASIPSYAELLARTDGPPGSAWGLFGEDDQLGTLNFLSPERTRTAATLVRTGESFSLDYPLNAFAPSPAGTRPDTAHHIFSNNQHHRDDWLDSFYLQSTTQVDGLRHIRHPRHGFYAGVPDARIDVGTPELGVQLMADTAISGRGVLIDLHRYFQDRGAPLRPDQVHRITPAELDSALAYQGVNVQEGDLLLIRTGWAEQWLAREPGDRDLGPGTPGLDQSAAVAAWLWDHRLALVAADNLGLEARPCNPDSPWFEPDEPAPARGPSHNGLLHRVVIPLLGMAIGELWRLDELATACAEDGHYDFMMTVKPLNLLGGVGSPANAMAIR